MKSINFFYIVALGFIFGSFYSCTQKPLIAQNFPINGESWSYKQALDTTFTITDTLNSYNIYFTVRNTNDYPYQNLFILYKISATRDSTQQKRTRSEFKLANLDGKWLGKGSGAIYENKFLLKKNFKFSQAGNYRIHIEQNMRNNPLKGVSDIGFSVESINP